MSKTCSKCNDKLKRSDMVVCRSICGQYFHKDCVGITVEESNILSKSKNLSWQCNTCSHLNFSTFLNRFTDLSNCISDLKREISSMRDILSHIGGESVNVPLELNKSNTNDLLKSSAEVLVNDLLEPNDASYSGAANQNTTENQLQTVNQIHSSGSEYDPSLLSNNNNSDLNVNKVNKKNRSRRPISSVYGTNINSDLNVVPDNKWLHISRFVSNTDPESIINHISKNTDIPSYKFKCFKLTKKDAVLSELSFVNFKLCVPANNLDAVMNPSAWPEYVRVKMFIPSPKNEEHRQNKIATI
ncbi:uncharacterized protein LOC129948096 [Eupeodes corollae]|uniref:uncharacterized protein LOC129948096 n=1 Tax=Eupeodes corollae TaxID=290404 RepID=UPI0024924BAD|nr:uncharacterized protein LOC129948096 [Eupeodes corollae]